jgi:hypothetical protein
MDKIAAAIPVAAELVGISESALRNNFIRTGLVVPVDLGGRGESIILADLRAAVERKAAEQRADPSLKKMRNSNATQLAAGRPPNPYGRAGKPKKAARG